MHYIRHVGTGTPVVLMHGWGGSIDGFRGTFDFLAGLDRETVAVDFHGFGASPPPPSDWGIYDYAGAVCRLAESLGYTEFIPVGHSFGGRVAIVLGHLDAVKKLVLVDAAGMKPRRGLRYRARVAVFKLGRKLGLNPTGGSADYRALDPSMREVFKRVVNTHLERELPTIVCPTLIVWGDNDRETPMYMAKRLNKGIADSAVVTLKGGHYAYVENAYAFNRILQSFIG